MSNWVVTAHRVLQDRDPEMFERLRKAKELMPHLERKAKEASETYKMLVKMAEKNHPAWFARKQAEELVIRDILDPTT